MDDVPGVNAVTDHDLVEDVRKRTKVLTKWIRYSRVLWMQPINE